MKISGPVIQEARGSGLPSVGAKKKGLFLTNVTNQVILKHRAEGKNTVNTRL